MAAGVRPATSAGPANTNGIGVVAVRPSAAVRVTGVAPIARPPSVPVARAVADVRDHDRNVSVCAAIRTPPPTSLSPATAVAPGSRATIARAAVIDSPGVTPELVTTDHVSGRTVIAGAIGSSTPPTSHSGKASSTSSRREGRKADLTDRDRDLCRGAVDGRRLAPPQATAER